MTPHLFFIPLLTSIRKKYRDCPLSRILLVVASLFSVAVLAGTTETNYRYDDLGRVKTVEYVNTASHTYDYDAADNRTGKQVVITPDTTPPSQPGTISFSNITASTAIATWSAATDDRGIIDSYEYSYNNANPWVSVGTALTATLTGRAPNTTYNFYVRAKDAAKNPGPSRSGNFKTLTDILPPIISGVVSCPSTTSTSLTVTWWAASDNVAVTDYEYSYNNKANWFSAGAVTTKTITGLSPSTLYTVYVHAKDAAGNTSADISGMCTTSGDTSLPGQPGVPTISNVTNTSATAAWTAATDDVGVTGYEYKLDSGPWISVGTALTVDLTGLTRNTTYTFYVRAKDAASNYTLIPSSKPFTTTNIDSEPPSAPGTPSFSNISNTSATATWTAATDNFGVTGYEYKVDNGSWASVGLALTANLSGLTANTTYTVYARAKDAAGNYTLVPSSKPFTTTNVDPVPPTAPGTPSFSNITNTSAIATWAAATDNVGVTGYEYKVDNGSWVSVGLALTASLPGLTANTPYTVYVRAKDAAGNYSTTPSSNGFSTLNLIGPPGNPAFSSIGVNSVSASWTAATGNVASYEYSINSGSTWTNVGNTLTTTISGLSAGSTYGVLIRGRSTSGVAGQPSSPGGVTTLNGNPGTPVASNITTTTATLTWTASSGTVSSYQYSINSGSTWIDIGNVLSVNLTGLTSGTTYTFYVQPKNTAGIVGPVAQPISFPTESIDSQPPTQPGSVYVPDMSYPTAPATWTAASDNVGVVRYEYTLDNGTTWVNVGNVLSTTLSGLAAGQNYTFYVRAVDAANNAGPSGYTGFSTRDVAVPSTPGVPVISNLTMTSFSVSWSASTDNIGVQSYWYSLDGGVTNVNVGLSLSANISGLTPNTYQTIWVFAMDAAGNRSVASYKGFKTYPYPPTSAFVDAITATTATAHWNYPADARFSGYEYSLDGSNWIFVGSNTNQVALSALAASTTYIFRVRTIDLEGQLSSESTYQFTTSNQVVSVSSMNISRSAPGYATYELNSNGSIIVSSASGSGTETKGFWLSPQVGANQYEVRAIVNPNYTNCVATTAWINLSTSPIWKHKPSTSPQYSQPTPCIFNIEIRRVSAPANILSSAQILLMGVY